jgi:RNA polymerase sigma-70 factor (ECF subfamily)
MAETTADVSHWLAAARAGSREALAQLLAEHHALLLALARQQLPAHLQSKGGASDLVQEALLQAYQRFAHSRCRTPAQLRAWLRQILRHQLADFCRRYQGAGKRDPGREVRLAQGRSSAGPADGSASPGEQVVADEEDRAVWQTLDRLPPDYRRVLQLRIWEGLPFEGVGRALGLSANAARKLYARAVRRVRVNLESHS